MPLRVLLVANTLPPDDLSGVGEQVVQLAAGLREAGHEVTILGRGPQGARGPKSLFPLAIVPALRRALRDLRPDVVQVHESDCGLAALWLGRRRRLRGWTLVALQQVSYVEERRAVRALTFAGRILGEPGAIERRFRWLKAPLQIALGRWSARSADLVVAPSAATANEIRRDYGVRDVGVVPNATGGLQHAATTLPGTEGAHGFLLFVGRLRIRKGVDVLLAARAEMSTRGCDVPLFVVGEGEHREALCSRAAALGFGEDRVRFLGRASAGEVRDLLARASALVVPSIYEGMPLVVLEAMECGVPIVASAVSGIPEVVVDGETGWLVPAEDPPALASALAELLSDSSEALRRGERARERVAACYRPRHAAAIWEALVAPLVRERER